MSFLPPVVAALVLFLAMLSGLPYGYFQIMRWLVCAAACYGIYKARLGKQPVWVFVMVSIAILFNPVATIHFQRDAWRIIDCFSHHLLNVNTDIQIALMI